MNISRFWVVQEVPSRWAFASSLASLMGSGIAPWRVNLSNSFLAVSGSIPALLA